MLGAIYEGCAYRQCSPRYAEVTPATLEGSRSAGGRFNPPGEFGAIYLSLEPETAVRELRRRAERLAIPADALLPRTLLTVDVRLRQVLDLTDTATRREWGLTPADLAAADFRACHDAARAARRAGYEAVRFPSATGEGTNLAVFLDRLHPGSGLEVVGREELDLRS